MKLRLFLLLPLVSFSQWSFGQSDFPIYHNEAVEHSLEYRSGNKFQKDLLLLTSMMKETHPSIMLGVYKYDIDSLQNQYCHSLSGEGDSPQFIKAVRQFLCTFDDSHTGLNFRPDQSWIYPIALSCDGDRTYISGIQYGYDNLLGKDICSINGMSPEELFSEFRQFLPSDNPFYFKSKLNNVLPYYSLWEEEKLAPADSVMLVKTGDGNTVAIKPLRQRQLKVNFTNSKMAYPVMTPRKELFCYSIVDSLKLCYLQFNSCQDRKTLRDRYKSTGNLTGQVEEQINRIPAFDEFIREMFTEIGQRQVRTLIEKIKSHGKQLCKRIR